MNPMVRRLRLLEQAYQVEVYVERADSPATIVRARRLRRLQEAGIVPEPRPPVQYSRGMTVADILRQGRLNARSRSEVVQ
jgi:hypothetical protein